MTQPTLFDDVPLPPGIPLWRYLNGPPWRTGHEPWCDLDQLHHGDDPCVQIWPRPAVTARSDR